MNHRFFKISKHGFPLQKMWRRILRDTSCNCHLRNVMKNFVQRSKWKNHLLYNVPKIVTWKIVWLMVPFITTFTKFKVLKVMWPHANVLTTLSPLHKLFLSIRISWSYSITTALCVTNGLQLINNSLHSRYYVIQMLPISRQTFTTHLSVVLA